MATQILFPKIGFAMSKGTLVEWLVAEGAEVLTGQPLYALESDKAIEEIPAPATGCLKIIVAADTECAVGDLVGEIS